LAAAAATAAAADVAATCAAPAAELLQQAKASFTSSSSALSTDLSSILSKELKHEKAVAEKSEVVAAVSVLLGCNMRSAFTASARAVKPYNSVQQVQQLLGGAKL
jgi:hypothetical protein